MKKKVKKEKPGKNNPFLNMEPEDTDAEGGSSEFKECVELVEALSVKARRKLAQRMIRMARRMAVARKKAAARFAPNANLKRRAQKMARSIFRKRLAGKRGEQYSKLGMSDKIAIDKLVDKQGKRVAKLVKRIFPAIKRAEAIRLQKRKKGSDDANDQRHKKKFHGRKAS